MPNHVSIAAAIDKGKLSSLAVYIMLLEVDVLDPVTRGLVETVRVCHNDEPFVFAGQTYTNLPLEIDVRHAKAELPRMSLSVKDPFGIIQGRVQEYDGLLGCPVRIKVVSTLNLDQPEIEERFTITGCSSSSESYGITFEIGAENPIAMRFPVRKQFRDRCFWRYKGDGCFYNGPLPTCSFQVEGDNGCKAHNNLRNFGGFRGLRRRNVA